MFLHKTRIGIRTKSILILILVFILGELALYHLSTMKVEDYIEVQIAKDIRDIKANTEVYVKQILILNFANNDEASFQEYSKEIMMELYNAGKRHIALYTTDGTMLCASNEELFTRENKSMDDLKKGKLKQAAFTIQYGTNNSLDVYFSMPAFVEDRYVGIVRYYIDYSALRAEYTNMVSSIAKVAAVVFAVIFSLVVMILNIMIKPIRKLARISNQVTHDIENNQFDGKHDRILGWSEREDEIGKLTNNYKMMLKTVEEQLEKLKHDKEEIYRLMESKKEFYDNVTHELKTPLTTITGYAQLLESDGIRDRELFDKGIRTIQEESNRLHKMVVQLLEMADYSRLQNKMPIYIEPIITVVADSMELKAKRYDKNIETHIETDLVIMGHADRVRQVIINLIDNAIKYGSANTSILVEAENKSGGVEVRVTNKGRGLAKEEMKHIFEPFYRVDKEYSREQGSAGLGLSICSKIMEEHRGEIAVTSIPNEETSFILRFPSVHEDAKEERDV